MAWIPSHQELRDHPKTRKAARRAGVSLPTLIGHLHLLWYWALDHCADGDLSRFDAEDLADGAMWEGDPETFVKALIGCGSSDGPGFLSSDYVLHDWDQYGGKYAKRVADGKAAAAKRWHSDGNGSANGNPVGTQSRANGSSDSPIGSPNAEERRGEEKPRSRGKPGTTAPDDFTVGAKHRKWAADNGVTINIARETGRFLDHHRAKGSRFKDWDAAWRNWMSRGQEYADERKPVEKAWTGVGNGWGANDD